MFVHGCFCGRQTGRQGESVFFAYKQKMNLQIQVFLSNKGEKYFLRI